MEHMTHDLSRPEPRPDARLLTLHAERGDPHARLAAALAALEGADWGLTLAGEAALARQLAALLGPGVLRVDERLGVSRALLADQGLAAATLDADWSGARAVWLAEPDERLLRRAARINVPVIVDATLAPGSGWFERGAAYVVYRHGVTLTGFEESPLALLFGQGSAPAPAAPAPTDLTVALALRDVATLPLRLARIARTVTQLAERLGGRALPFGPTALLLPPDAAPDTPHRPGGVLAGTRNVDGGVVFAPGLQDAETALALLHPASHAPDRVETPLAVPPRLEEKPRRSEGDRPDQPNQPDVALPDRPEPLVRVTFEAPAEEPPHTPQEEEPWTPEIVFSDHTAEVPTPLPIPVSAGPDAPELEVTPPLATAEPAEEATAEAAAQPDAPAELSGDAEPAEPAVAPETSATADLTPDLPAAAGDGAAPDPAADLTDEQAAIYARLREWRNAEARRQEVSRFIIASNATLAEIARRVPYTMDDLKAVRGMGPERLKKYGEKILEVVRG